MFDRLVNDIRMETVNSIDSELHGLSERYKTSDLLNERLVHFSNYYSVQDILDFIHSKGLHHRLQLYIRATGDYNLHDILHHFVDFETKTDSPEIQVNYVILICCLITSSEVKRKLREEKFIQSNGDDPLQLITPNNLRLSLLTSESIYL